MLDLLEGGLNAIFLKPGGAELGPLVSGEAIEPKSEAVDGCRRRPRTPRRADGYEVRAGAGEAENHALVHSGPPYSRTSENHWHIYEGEHVSVREKSICKCLGEVETLQHGISVIGHIIKLIYIRNGFVIPPLPCGALVLRNFS